MKHTTLDIQFREALEENEIEFDMYADDTFIIKGKFQKAEIFINEDSEFELELCSHDSDFTGKYEHRDFIQGLNEVMEAVQEIYFEGVGQ